MRKIYLLFFSLGLFAVVSSGQNQNSIIKIQAMDMARALLKKDFPAFTKFMHPQVVAMAGGEDKMLQRMDTVNSIARQFGAEIKKILIGNPGNIVRYKKDLQVTLPQTTEMKTGFGNLTLETTLIGISKDGGKNWYFIDTSVYNVQDVKKAMPDLSPNLVIPPAKPPKFVPDQN